VKILVVDDHHLIRDGLRPLLEELSDGQAVQVFEAATLAEGLEVARREPDLDVALVDLGLPDAQGYESISTLRTQHPSVPVVVMSGEDEPRVVREALDHGAIGFIPKSSGSRVILGALRLVLSGGTYIPREAIGGDLKKTTPARDVGAPAHNDEPVLGLTPRQAQVLKLILAGKSNKAIGRDLDLAEGTVKNHVAAVLKALDVTTRTQAVIAAARLGIRD
jgi:DNA-binding NarL/FixJ family response regulator